MRVGRRARWRNHTGNQGIDPLRRCTPRSLEEVVELVREAEAEGCTVRAVGSGHSWSDAALTSGFLLEPHGLARPLELEEELLREQPNAHARHAQGARRLVRCEAGMPLRALNAHLDRRGLALLQLGGYDRQTVAGVISTSTHGSGIGLGPICDYVRSMDLVASGGAIYRIEGTSGPTDPDAYAARHPERMLVQSDHWLDAALVGMGCLGVIHSVMLEVGERYWLKEVRTLQPWGEVKEALREGAVLRRHRHYEVYISPYRPRDGDRCLVTTRNPVDRPPGRPHARRRSSLPELAATLPITPRLLNLVTGLRPSLTPRLLDAALRALADEELTHRSFKVLNIGAANLLPAYSSEIGVPVDARGTHVEAVERIMEIAERRRRLGDLYHTSPISLRFVKASPAYMSMMHGRDTMMIELIQMTRTEGGFEALAAYEDALYDLGGRPHWGQLNTLTGSLDRVRSLYPRFDDWLDVHARLNASGAFDGPFSKRVGISARG